MSVINDNRKTGNTDVNLNAPTAVPDVARLAPPEFEGAIREYDKKKAYIAEMAKTGMRLAIDVNDYNANLNADQIRLETRTDYLEEQNQLHLDIEEMKREATNKVSDRYQKTVSDVQDAMINARNKNENVYDAAVGTLDAHRNPDELDSPYQKETYQHLYNQYALHTISQAKEEQVIRDTANMDYNMDMFISSSVDDVLNKGISIDDAFAGLMTKMQAYRGQMDAAAFEKKVRGGYNTLVGSMLNYVANNTGAGLKYDYDTGRQLINNIVTNYANKTYEWTDPKGEVVGSIDLFLDPQVLNTVTRLDSQMQAQEATAKVEGGTTNYEDAKELWNYDQIKKTGWSSALTNTTQAEIEEYIAKGMQTYAGKPEKLRDFLFMGNNLLLLKGMGDAVIAGNSSPQQVQAIIAKLERDLNSGNVDWLNYQISMPGKDGALINVSAPSVVKQHIDSATTAKLYWQDALPLLKSFANQGRNSSDFVSMCSPAYAQAEAEVQAIFANNLAGLVSGSGGAAVVNPVQKRELDKRLVPMRQLSNDHQVTNIKLQDNTIASAIQSLGQLGDLPTRFIAADALASSLVTSGYAGSVVNYISKLRTSGSSKGIDQGHNLLLASCYLQSGNAKNYKSMVQQALVNSNGNIANMPGSLALDEQGVTSASYNDLIRKEVVKYGLGAHTDNIISTVSLVLAASPASATKNIDKSIQNIVTDLVQSNFHISDKKTGIVTPLYNGSGNMVNQNFEKFDSTCLQTKQKLEEIFKNTGLEGRITFAEDPATGKFVIQNNGKALTTFNVQSGTSNPVGIIDPAQTMHGSRANAGALSTVYSTRALVHMMAYDNTFRQNATAQHRAMLGGAEARNRALPSTYYFGEVKPTTANIKDKQIFTDAQIRNNALLIEHYMDTHPDYLDKFLANPAAQAPGKFIQAPGTTSNFVDQTMMDVARKFTFSKNDLNNIVPTIRRLLPDNPQVLNFMHYIEQHMTGVKKVSSADVAIDTSLVAMANSGTSALDMGYVAQGRGFVISSGGVYGSAYSVGAGDLGDMA